MLIRSQVLTLFMMACLLSPDVFSQDSKPQPAIILADSLMNDGRYEDAIASYVEFIDSAGKRGDEEIALLAGVYEKIALCYYSLDKYNETIEWFKKTLDLQKESGDLENVANTLNNIGLNYKILGKYDQAIEYYKEAIAIDEQLGNKSGIAKTCNNIGMVYRSWSEYDQAIEYFEKSLRLKNELADRQGVSTTLNNIGLVYTEWQKYDQAILNFKESLSVEEAEGNNKEIANRLNNLGRVYFKLNQLDTALAYFQNALQIQLKLNGVSQAALIYNNIGKIYIQKGKYPEALSYLSSALEIYTGLGMESELSTVLANLGDLNRILGNHGLALKLIDSSSSIARRLHHLTQLQQNYLFYSNLYSDQKNFEKSLEYYRKYTEMKDSVFTTEILSQLSDFQVKYEKEKDQARILMLEKENLRKTLQRNAYMFTGLAVLILAAFLVLYFRQRSVHVRIISEQKIQHLEEEKKLIAAKLLVEGQEEERKRIATELHDGLGVLLSATKLQFSIIHDKSPENKELIEKATRMLEQATGDVRKISHNMMPGLLTKLGFYEAVEDLCEKVSDSGEIRAVCTIDGDKERLAENREIMLYRIVQEMVNNTIKHARAKNIMLNISVKSGGMDVVYSDNGIGFDLDEMMNSKSIGLKSIQSRVNFLNGHLEIDTKPGAGVKYSVRLSL